MTKPKSLKTLKLPDRSKLEADFRWLLKTAGRHLPDPEPQYRFHSERKWRFDFAWPQAYVAVEIEGLLCGPGGRHQRMGGFTRDCEKYNAAVVAGWKLLRYTRAMLKDPGQVVGDLEQLLLPRS